MASCILLAALTLNCLGFLWAQNTLLESAASAVALSAPSRERDAAHVARIESLVQLRTLAGSRLQSRESMVSLVSTVASNIRNGIIVLAALLLLLFTTFVFLVRRLQFESVLARQF